MNKELREKVAGFLEHTGIFKVAIQLKMPPRMLQRMGQFASKAKGPLAGAAVGAGGMMGLNALGQRDLEKQQAAAEMQQLLQAYPELMYEIPSAVGYSEDPYAQMGGGGMPPEMMGGGGGGMPPEMMGGGGGELPPDLMMMLQQQQGGAGPY